MTPPPDGPSLATYVETRFNLLEQKIKDAQDHSTRLLQEQDRRYEERYKANQIALDKVAAELNSRFEAVNEFRKLVEDQQRLFMPRGEAEAKLNSLEARIDLLSTQLDRFHSERQGAKGGWTSAAGVVALMLSAIALITAAINFIRLSGQ